MELPNLALEKIAWGEKLLNSLVKFHNLEGAQKLQRKIKQELNFLKKIYKNNAIKPEHLQCSNLTHLTALIETLNHNVKDCVALNKAFYKDGRKLIVDIVCDNGLTWLKVVARNPKSLQQICSGDSSFGVRSIIDQAEDFLNCAQLHPCLFRTPKVVFVFANGIGDELAKTLEEMGVCVRGGLVNVNEDELGSSGDVSVCELSTKNVENIKKVNLDVSAMLAYVSSVTNGSCKLYEFSVPVLKQQAQWECERPQKPILDKFFEGKRLYCCETARNSFQTIVNTVGGDQENVRALKLLQKVLVLPDDATASDTIEGDVSNELFNHVQFTPDKKLLIGGKIRERSLVVFTFGDRIKAVTVTANDGFIRSARQQGINFVVFLHESRALTEQKEKTKAVKVVESV